MAGATGQLVTSAGTWTFNTPLSTGCSVMLHGRQAVQTPTAGEEDATHSSQKASNNGGSGGNGWYEWVNGRWTSVPDPNALTTIPGSLAVIANGAAQPLGIASPTDALFSASQLTVKVNLLPTTGTVLLSDGVTPIY